MYDKILVPTDGSSTAEKGENHAIELAAALDSTIYGLYVIEEGGNPWMSESMDDQQQRARSYGQELLDDFGARVEDAGATFESVVEVGPDVYKEINQYADEEEMDIVIMGTGYRGKIGGLLGSTAENVVRTSNRPVTTVRSMGGE